MAGTDSQDPEQLKARDPVAWQLVYGHDICPEYGTRVHRDLSGDVTTPYEPPRWMEDAIREARRNSERLS